MKMIIRFVAKIVVKVVKNVKAQLQINAPIVMKELI